MKQATKAHDEAVDADVRKDIKKARKVLKHAQIDVAYVYMFPKSEKYIALYPNEPLPEMLKDSNVKKGMQITDEKRQQYRKKMEELIDSDKLPFTFEDALAGKTIQVDEDRLPEPEEEVDAPQEQNNKLDEDDFFE